MAAPRRQGSRKFSRPVWRVILIRMALSAPLVNDEAERTELRSEAASLCMVSSTTLSTAGIVDGWRTSASGPAISMSAFASKDQARI